MSNAIITLQLGQCGNQIGFEFWKSLCADHGIDPNGEILETSQSSSTTETSEVFFYHADDKRYVPRSILVDLEPRVVNSIMNSEYSKLFSKENIMLSPEGGGAGNNWGKGYAQSRKLEEDLFEIVDRMAEDCESVDGITICHSMAGGTGSGMGSYVLECLVERYPKKTIQTFSIFPHQDEMGDVVVQPYNSLLMLERLVTYADSVLVLDNAAFQCIIEEHLKQDSPTYKEINALITKIMNMYTNPLRFPTYQFNTLTSLVAPMSPTSSMHFLIPSFTPWNTAVIRKKSLQRIMYDLLKPRNLVISNKPTNNIQHGFLAILDIIQGHYNPSKLFDAIDYIRENQFAKFVPWVPDSLQVVLANAAPNLTDVNYNSGLMLANHTSISIFLEKIIHDFDKLRKRNAFLGQFQNTGLFSENFAEMDLARDIADCLVQEYEAATKSGFIQWKPQKRGISDIPLSPS